MANIFDLFRKIESESAATHGPVSYIVAGLGNPGAEYERTRHNAGFLAIDRIAQSAGVKVDRVKFRALTAEATVGGARVLLMKPTTYMNASGEAIRDAAAFYKLPPERVIVLCDDISFSPGHLRIRRKGSAGGHNGLKSIIACLGSDAFVRFRLGVGQKPSPDYDLVSWVLGTFPRADMDALTASLADVEDALSLWLSGKEELAMSRHSK